MRQRYRRPASTALFTSLLCGMAGAQSVAGGLETVATTATNGLEGIDVDRQGTLYVTDATAHVIHRIAPDGGQSVFAKLDVVPQVILLTRGGAVVTAQERDPDFSVAPTPRGMSATTMGALGAVLVVLDSRGQVVKTLHGAPGAFFNGMDRFGRDYLIADSTAGVIWRYSVRRDSIEVWLKDAQLLGPNGQFPGGNGLKVVGEWVYVANSAASVVYRIGSSHGKPKGALTTVAQVPDPDDFAVAGDGTIYLPSRGQVLKIAASGAITTLAEGCTGCDTARLTDHGRSLLLVTHGFGPAAGSGHVYRLRL